MRRTRKPYPPEFREQIVALARAGRSIAELAREFEPSYSAWSARFYQRPPPGSRGRPTRCLRIAAFEFVSAYQATYPVATMCRLLEVSTSGYYDWRDREPSARAREDAALLERIRMIHQNSYGTYGAPRVQAELRAEGTCVGRNRVARLMQQAALEGVSRRRGPTTTIRKREHESPPDLVERDFSASAPNQLWVADITYVPTGSGFLYLAVAMDAFSRRIVG